MADEAHVTLRTLTDSIRPGGVASLREELSFLSRLRHPQLSHILDFGVLDRGQIPFSVRYYAAGTDAFRGSDGWNRDQILDLLATISRVLQFLHSRGVVHRHVKPSNVILAVGDGSEVMPKILDFGLERTGKRSGCSPASLAYVAPEILIGHAANPRSDLYSLGILAYQLLARRLPFDDDDEGYLIQKHLQGKADMRPIERLKGGSGLAQVLFCLLEKDPEKRPSSADDVVRLLSAASGRDYSGTVSGSAETYFSAGRFVGRQEEMAFLQERAKKVRENGRGWTVFLEGESGTGKSRCFEELRPWALLEGWRVVEASCHLHEDRSYAPYRRILAQAGLLRPPATKDSEDAPIFRFEDASHNAAELQVELSSGSAAGPFRDQLTREVVRLLSNGPMLLLLHDFHWADEATIAVLDYLTSDILAHPIFICVSFRPGEADPGPLGRLVELSVRQQRAEMLALGALPPVAVEDMIAGITCTTTLAKEIGLRVHKASGGNPFFVEEILKHLVDRKLLQRESSRWRLAGKLDDLEVPSSVAAVLRHRLAQLSPGAATATEWLALIKGAVPKDHLRTLCSLGAQELESLLRELLSRQIIQEAGGGCFEFQHALISEVIREDLPTRRRRRMHQRIGEMLEAQQCDPENLQELALHFTEGRSGEKAVGYAMKAARACKAEFANDMALRFYEYLLGNKNLMSQEQFCQVSIEAADTYCALGNPKRAIKILESQLGSVGKKNISLAVQLYTQLSRSFQFLGALDQSERAAKCGIKLLGGLADCEKEATETLLLSQLAFCLGNRSHPLRALDMLKYSSCMQSKTTATLAAGHLHILISGLYWVACDFEEGSRVATKAIKILEPLKAYHLLPMAYSHLGINLAGLGKLGKALNQHQKAVSAGKHTRSLFLQTQALCNLVECRCRLGQLDLAAADSTQVARISSQTDNCHVAYAGTLCLLETQIAIGDWSSALETRKDLTSREKSSLPGYVKAQALLLSALLNVELGSFENAISDLGKLEKLKSTKTPIYEVSLGEWLRARIFILKQQIPKARRLLERLEIEVTKRHWAYQTALFKLALAEVYIVEKDWSAASSRARASLRLSIAMPAYNLQAQARYLLGKIAVLQAESFLVAEYAPVSEGALDNQKPLMAASLELQKAINLSNTAFTIDTKWRAHHMIMRADLLNNDLDSAYKHAQEALRLQSIVESRVPAEMLDVFRNIEERRRAKLECESLIHRHSGMSENASLSMGEMEGEHLRILCQASNAINAIRDIDPLMTAICSSLSKAVRMDRVLIALLDEKTGTLKSAGKRNIEMSSLEDLDSLSLQVVHEVFRTGQPFVTANSHCDPRLSGKELAGAYAGSLFCAPLATCGQTLGLVYADHRLPVENLSVSTINLFAAFCNIAAVAIENALAHRHLVGEKNQLEQYIRQVKADYPEMVGRSPAMEKLRERIRLAADSPLDILISGESGTGKELVARALHRTGRRAAGKFVPLDCGSLSDSLAESEFFGYRKGAFTGAMENRPGLFEAADGGVIFLDEISNLSVRLQRKLLRVLQEREVRRIGETMPRKVNVQVIAATNKDLQQEIRKGKFREDLYFRLYAMEIVVPPLRERVEDVPLLLEWYLDMVGRNEGGRTKYFTQEAYALLSSYSYPGNVRQLMKMVERAYYSIPGNIIEAAHVEAILQDAERLTFGWEPASAAWQVYKKIREGQGHFEDLVKTPFLKRQIGCAPVRQVIHLALAETGGRYREAFRLLGIPEREYAIVMQFLKRNDCYLDFRLYRKPRH
jgi:transcriptional regulator with GAF, ATPase, and Fis domain/tetratricopeptide (TPR) repeat protein